MRRTFSLPGLVHDSSAADTLGYDCEPWVERCEDQGRPLVNYSCIHGALRDILLMRGFVRVPSDQALLGVQRCRKPALWIAIVMPRLS